MKGKRRAKKDYAKGRGGVSLRSGMTWASARMKRTSRKGNKRGRKRSSKR